MGNLDLGLLGQLLIGSLPGIFIGSMLSGKVPDLFLRNAIAGMLFFVGYKLVFMAIKVLIQRGSFIDSEDPLLFLKVQLKKQYQPVYCFLIF
jgi:uncharacterized membrane protein YfcA